MYSYFIIVCTFITMIIVRKIDNKTKLLSLWVNLSSALFLNYSKSWSILKLTAKLLFPANLSSFKKSIVIKKIGKTTATLFIKIETYTFN